MEKLLEPKQYKRIMWIMLLLLVVAFFLPYVTVNRLDYTWAVWVDGIYEDTNVKISGAHAIYTLIEDAFFTDLDGIKACFEDSMDAVLYRIYVCLLMAYAFLLINIILFIRKKWNKVCFIILHTSSYLLIQSYHFIIAYTKNQIKAEIDEEMGIFSEFLGDFTDSVVDGGMELFKGTLGSGYWLFTIVGAIIFILLILDTQKVRSLIGINTMGEEQRTNNQRQMVNVKINQKTSHVPQNDNVDVKKSIGMLRVMSGKYAGAEITLLGEEWIIIGRDSKQCHLILEAPNVSGVHCRIHFSALENVYYVSDESTNGTYQINQITRMNEVIGKGKTHRLPKGSVITIGNDGDQILLV